MAIDVEIQDENGNALARYEGPPLGLRFLKLAPADSTCFRFIDPWGDATFNEEQIKVLRAEFEAAISRASDIENQRELKALLEFLAGATGVHTYVKFIGD